MKIKLPLFLLMTLLIYGCSTNSKITVSWISPEAQNAGPYSSIFVMVLAQNMSTSFDVEDRMAQTIISRGNKAVLSSSVFPPNLADTLNFGRKEMAEAIKRTGCDAVFVIAVLDELKTETYHSGSAYYPMNYGMYGSYYGYYNYHYPYVYSRGYYSADRTYYIETNFYDLASDKLLWSIQSEAHNPSSIEAWFHEYSYQLLKELKKEGLINEI